MLSLCINPSLHYKGVFTSGIVRQISMSSSISKRTNIIRTIVIIPILISFSFFLSLTYLHKAKIISRHFRKKEKILTWATIQFKIRDIHMVLYISSFRLRLFTKTQ